MTNNASPYAATMISKKSPNPEAAMQFLNWQYDPGKDNVLTAVYGIPGQAWDWADPNEKYYVDRFETDAGQIYAGEFMIATGLGTDTWFAPNTEDLKRHYGGDPHKFRGILVVTTLWQEVGWGTILYLAAISNIDPRLYEASVIDGAGKWRQTRHITLPGITFVIVILLIFRVGGLLSAGFEQILLLYSPPVYELADILDTYVYCSGIISLKYSFATAVGLFQGAARGRPVARLQRDSQAPRPHRDLVGRCICNAAAARRCSGCSTSSS